MREAVVRLEAVATVKARSRVIETAPIGGPPQDAYLNAAVFVEYNGSPLALLDELQRIEAEAGRTRDVRWGPRTLDLDVLWAGDVTIDHPRLVVPHPRLAERAFALVPLLDVAPDARDPSTGQPYVVPHDQGIRPTTLSL